MSSVKQFGRTRTSPNYGRVAAQSGGRKGREEREAAREIVQAIVTKAKIRSELLWTRIRDVLENPMRSLKKPASRSCVSETGGKRKRYWKKKSEVH